MIPPFEMRRRRPVKFTYPEGTVELYDLVDEVGVDAEYEYGCYRYLLQFLKRRGDGQECIRGAYYRQPPGKTAWYFASQTSITAERNYWVDLFARAIEKDWFKSIIDEARSRIDPQA